MIVKIGVLASGAVLLDGEPVELERLDGVLREAQEKGGAVWYYREAAALDPASPAWAVMQMITRRQLPVRFSSRPDYSDYVDAEGVSRPQTAPTVVRMPEVDLSADLERIFAKARSVASGETPPRSVVVVTPARRFLILPPPAETPTTQLMAAMMEKIISPSVSRNVVSIANTEITAASGKPTGFDANRVIPFFGLLMGLSYIGHAVWVFEGHESALAAGCRDADVLIADSAMLPLLPPGWQERASAVMRNPNILAHDRLTYRLRVMSTAGSSPDRLNFR